MPAVSEVPSDHEKISEMQTKPLSPESQKILKGIVDAAYAKLAERLHHSAGAAPDV